MNLEELEARLRNVEDQLEIDKLEKIYGYYLDNYKYEEAIDLFSDDAESIEIGNRGVFKGKAGVRRFFLDFMKRDFDADPIGRMGLHHQLQSVVTVAPGGKTANGRWYILTLAAAALEPGGPKRSLLTHGVYENEFVKENGKWKIKKMFMASHFACTLPEGWTKTPYMRIPALSDADAPPTAYHPYPNLGYVPFHWENPAES